MKQLFFWQSASQNRWMLTQLHAGHVCGFGQVTPSLWAWSPRWGLGTWPLSPTNEVTIQRTIPLQSHVCKPCTRRFRGDLCNPCFQRRCLFFQVGKLSAVIHAGHCGWLRSHTLSLLWCCVCVIVFSLRTDAWPCPPHNLSIHTVTLHPLNKWETNIWGTIICGHLLLAAQ